MSISTILAIIAGLLLAGWPCVAALRDYFRPVSPITLNRSRRATKQDREKAQAALRSAAGYSYMYTKLNDHVRTIARVRKCSDLDGFDSRVPTDTEEIKIVTRYLKRCVAAGIEQDPFGKVPRAEVDRLARATATELLRLYQEW